MQSMLEEPLVHSMMQPPCGTSEIKGRVVMSTGDSGFFGKSVDISFYSTAKDNLTSEPGSKGERLARWQFNGRMIRRAPTLLPSQSPSSCVI